MNNEWFGPDRSSALRSVTVLLLLAGLSLAAGCVAPKRASFVVPKRCIKVDSQSFTRPCRQQVDGKIMCDGVIVTATCVEAAH